MASQESPRLEAAPATDSVGQLLVDLLGCTSHAGVGSSEQAECEATRCPVFKPVDLSADRDGGVLKVVLKEGEGDEQPVTHDRVRVHCVGQTAGGSIFTNSRDYGVPITFKLNSRSGVVMALRLAILTMRQGEVCRVACKPGYGYGHAGAPPLIGPDEILLFELELLSWNGRDISEEKNGSIRKSVLSKGTGDYKPTLGSEVKVNLIGKIGGRQFESRDVTFTCGDGLSAGVINGVDIAIRHSLLGETSRLKIKSEYAFGQAGHDGFVIPPGADVTYEITLKEFAVAKEPWEMTFRERLQQSQASKERGTRLYEEGRLRHALAYYERAVALAEDKPCTVKANELSPLQQQLARNAAEHEDPQLRSEQRILCLAAQLNVALCLLKLERFTAAREQCDLILHVDVANKKALFRRAQANMGFGDWEAAKHDCARLLKVDPDSAPAKAQLAVITKKLKECDYRDKACYAGALQKLAAHPLQGIRRPEDRTLFDEPVEQWSNKLADGIMPLPQEVLAFDESMSDDEDTVEIEGNPSQPQG